MRLAEEKLQKAKEEGQKKEAAVLIIEEEKKQEVLEEVEKEIALAAMEADCVDDDGSQSYKSDLTVGDE